MYPSTRWASPSPLLFRNRSPEVVHVWRAHPEDSAVQAARYRPDLSADERLKAERYRFPHLQHQFISTRGILRRLLSRYVGIPAAKLQIETNPQGKPVLADPGFLPIQFNVSHTSGMTLLVIAVEHAVGVDVENIGRTVSAEDIAARYFSSRESAHLASLSPERRMQEFFTYWTCKEAHLKMRGVGLTGGLAQCEIAFNPDGVKAHVSWGYGQITEDTCSLIRVRAGQRHIGAVAVNCPSVEFSFWDWID